MTLDADRVRRALADLADPAGRPLAARIDTVDVQDGVVRVALRAARADAAAYESIRAAAEAMLARLPGTRAATVILTAERPAAPPAPAAAGPRALAQVRHIVAVASGKGGVGKSTVAVNLAVALAAAGAATGLLDADIHGPSVARMLGFRGRPAVRDGLIQPAHAWGVAAMSMGLLVEEAEAMVWRGPMVMGALRQLIEQVAWPPLDAMVVDMPPGTGDAQLTIGQRLDLAGAVIVSTPQDIALIDARRGVRMFEKIGVPILGIVENMSYFRCPDCGGRHDIFGHGGARAEAARLGVPFLAEIPILPAIRTHADIGTPIAAADPSGEAGRAYAALAKAVLEAL